MADRVSRAVLMGLVTGSGFLWAIAPLRAGAVLPVLAQAPSGSASQPSPNIQQLQARLAELGYYSGEVDGLYNQATRDALARFQTESGLVGTGILDPLTQERLENPNAAQTASPPDAPATAPPDASTPAAPAVPETSPTEPSATPAPTSPTPGTATENVAPAAPEGTAQDAPATSSSEASGSEAPAPDAAAEGGEATSPDASPAPKPNDSSKGRNLLSLALLGLALLGVGGMGTAIVLFLARRDAKGEPEESAPPSEKPAAIVPPVASPTSHNGTPRSPRRAVAKRSKQAHSDPPEGWVDVDSAALSVPGTTEPRLARVNIIDELIQELDNPDPALRRKAIWELGQRGNSAAVQPLSALMINADSQEQGLILAALAEISMKTLKPMNRAIALALQDENPEVRKNAIRDITRVYDSLGQVGRLLGQAATDDDPEVRQTASWALKQLNHLRLSATDTARLLQDEEPERVSEDGSSSWVG